MPLLGLMTFGDWASAMWGNLLSKPDFSWHIVRPFRFRRCSSSYPSILLFLFYLLFLEISIQTQFHCPKMRRNITTPYFYTIWIAPSVKLQWMSSEILPYINCIVCVCVCVCCINFTTSRCCWVVWCIKNGTSSC
jgi:hypothetical protein